MLVTIGLCVRNCEETVRATVQSIVNQDFPHERMEIIIVDDGCTDNTLSAIKDLAARCNLRKRIYYNFGRGISSARQTVVENASGKYILWVDGDITMEADYVTRLVEFMEKEPHAGCVRGKWGRYYGSNIVAALENMKILYYSFEGTRKTSRLLGTAGTMQRVKALKEVGGFDTNIHGAGEDVDLEARMNDAGWGLYITDTRFFHKEKTSWRELWNQYFWWGYGFHYVMHGHKNAGMLWTRLPVVAFASGVSNSTKAYRLTNRKIAFLLPLQYFFKWTAWFGGFMKAHFNNYGHCG
jgi:glycosyltransferase involved in cell wall biosynthesis